MASSVGIQFAGTLPTPDNRVVYSFAQLTDVHPQSGQNVTFVFPFQMVAKPLAKATMGQGSPPQGNGPNWWPFFQERHKTTPNYWVRGHMLNDNIGGPGLGFNLVPITNTLNTNMLAMVEAIVKKAVLDQGKTVEYTVQAHWEGGVSWNQGLLSKPHVQVMRENYPNLLWGEQFAPTRLSWEAWELDPLYPHNRIAALSRSHNYDASTWMNHFPNF